MSRRALLLGGTGAIGAYLVTELKKRGFLVDVTTRADHVSSEGVRYIKGDGLQSQFLEDILNRTEYDLIVDFMVYTVEEFSSRIELLLNNTKHYIYLSSYRVFSDVPVITEKSPRLLDVSKDKEFLDSDDYSLEKAKQEDVLRMSKIKNWSIIRPAITYSKGRFQLGTLEANTLVWRSLQGKALILPRDMIEKTTTMTWAGDVAKMIAALALNKKSYGQDYNASTNEFHTWGDVLNIYKTEINLKVQLVDNNQYIDAIGGKYQLLYDRMFNRIMNNKKILTITGMKQSELMGLREGLHMELENFIRNPTFKDIDYGMQARIDTLTHSIIDLRQLSGEERKSYIKARFPRMRWLLRGVKHGVETIRIRLRLRTRLRNIITFSKKQKKVIVTSIRSIVIRIQYRRPDGVIVTLNDYSNYGNMIQRFALQEFLRQKGYKFLSYDQDLPIKNDLKDARLKWMVEFSDRYIPRKDFDKNDSFPIYIVGSDQVWRKWWWYKDESQELGYFFLNFVKNPEAILIAYAASFGKDTLREAEISPRFAKEIEPQLHKFSAISIREKSGVQIMKNEWGMTSEQVVDPTMLLDVDHYSKLIRQAPKELDEIKDIFTYMISETEEKIFIVDKISKQLNMEKSGIFLGQSGSLPPIEQWLKGFHDAKFTITDSFHGTVFSILNNTDFVVIENGIGGAARLENLLSMLGIKDRLIHEGDAKSYDVTKVEAISWLDVNKKLAKLREESSSWLLDVVKSGSR